MTSAIARSLQQGTDATAEGRFFAKADLPASTISVLVDGTLLTFPPSQNEINTLNQCATPAHFGLREQTILDPAVRDSKEIAAERLAVTIDPLALAQIVDSLSAQMGIPPHAKLTPHLHNLLIYGKGQFFKPHQDSEKLDNMVATLVICLPSAHIGGDLCVSHQQEQYRFVSENLGDGDARCFAFYADCIHEVEPVRQGWRVTLTYNLVLAEPVEHNTQPAMANPQLDTALDAYFNAPMANSNPFSKLVCYLDHDYSEHGLKWPLLKGLDAQRAHTLRHAAQRLGLRVHLALTQIHQCWDTNGDEDEPERYELIDGGTELNFWLDAQGQRQSYGHCNVSEDEEVWLRPLGETDLVETEFEGWMGNYGNTADYWYRRAAVVLWREADQLKIHFNLDYDQAINELLVLTSVPGNVVQLHTLVAQVGDTLARNLATAPAQTFTALAHIAAYLDDSAAAQRLLAATPRPILALDTRQAWLALQHAYGTDWCLAILTEWQLKRYDNYSLNTLAADLAAQLSSFIELGGDTRLAQFWLQRAGEQVEKNDQQCSKLPRSLIESMPTRIAQMTVLLETAAAIDAELQLATLIEHIACYPKLYPAEQLTAISLQISDHTTGRALRQNLLAQLETTLAQAVRQPGDWRIAAEPQCQCADCQVAMEFVYSSSESIRSWPLAEARRRHIRQVLLDLALPIECSEIRQGRPYQLVMRKATDLLRQDQARQAQIRQSYDSLNR